MYNFLVNIHPSGAANIIEEYVAKSGFSTTCIDRYHKQYNEKTVIVLIFEKYFMRNSSQASLTVTIENLNGVTSVHAVGSGGSQNVLFNFDWGASDSFEGLVRDALRGFIMSE